jgi:hypothetical protein
MLADAQLWTSAIGLREEADSATSAAVALLTLFACAALVYGLLHALVLNRRIQVVVTDLAVPGDPAEFAGVSALSSVARQQVEHDIHDQYEQVQRISKTILSAAPPELKPQFNHDAIMHVRRDANDSIATLSAALRAVVPGKADPLATLFSAVLPPPRGLLVTIMLLHRGTELTPRLGAAVDIVSLDRRPVASTMFWEAELTPQRATTDQPGTNERVLALLEPVARWIAVRLVVSLMVSPRRRATSRMRQGLRRLLAGGLFLAAMRDFADHALAFGDQACIELEEACQRMPEMTLPITTLAGVNERMGSAYQRVAKPEMASERFQKAVRLWKQAENLIPDLTDEEDEGRVPILVDRRLKAQLQTDEPSVVAAALDDVATLDSRSVPAALLGNGVWLYNRSCLYAQASRAKPDSGYQKLSLRWLGLALLRNPNPRSWAYATRDDPELAPIRESLRPFLACLKGISPQDSTRISQADAETLVSRALACSDDTSDPRGPS